MDRAQLEANMAAKAAELDALARRTDTDGKVAPIVPTEVELRTASLRAALDQALEAGDGDGAAVFAEALVRSAQHEAPANGIADQGARPSRPAPTALAAALAVAEASGDVVGAMRIKAARLEQLRSDLEAARRPGGFFR
jgi:hypothetical protein